MDETKVKNTFECAVCQGNFPKDTPIEEVEQEFKKNFPRCKIEKVVSVCDKCYREALKWRDAGEN